MAKLDIFYNIGIVGTLVKFGAFRINVIVFRRALILVLG